MRSGHKNDSRRLALQNFARAVVMACAGVCLLPSTAALAQQDLCQAQLNAGTEQDVLYYLNEPIGIVIELGAGVVVNSEPDGAPDNYLDIPQFTYSLDCTADGLPGCEDAGNTVVFVEDSVVTNCVDENNMPIDFETNREGDLVTFTPSPGSFIRNFSEQTCTVNFDVVVTDIAGDNPLEEIIELVGFVSTGEAAATCDNGLTAGAEATVSFELSTAITTFWVTKDFSDDNPLPVDVELRCNTGLPLKQSFTITDPAVGGQWPGVGFVVRDFEAGEMDCRIYEEPVPDGYRSSYLAGSSGGVAGEISDDDEGCHFDGVISGSFTCEITNAAKPASFTVTKFWLFDGAFGDEVDLTAPVTINCSSPILSVDGVPEREPGNSVAVVLSGDGDAVTVTVSTTDGTAVCSAAENIIQSGVELISMEGCSNAELPAGGSANCEITNQVFFEGIPTLSQRGVALMALLMLGIGMVGYRRFIG